MLEVWKGCHGWSVNNIPFWSVWVHLLVVYFWFVLPVVYGTPLREFWKYERGHQFRSCTSMKNSQCNCYAKRKKRLEFVKILIFITVDIFKHTAKKIRNLNEQITSYLKCMVPLKCLSVCRYVKIMKLITCHNYKAYCFSAIVLHVSVMKTMCKQSWYKTAPLMAFIRLIH
jgi:hypothetical protein